MIQYLRTERVIPPYQTRGYKLVELLRIYESAKGSKSRVLASVRVRVYGNANTNSDRPADAAMYCFPFTAYVIGLFSICAPEVGLPQEQRRCARRAPGDSLRGHR